MLIHFDADYDEWKAAFDSVSDPAGRAQFAEAYMISRGVDNPNDIFLRVECASIEKAKEYREKLIDTGLLETFTVKTPPTVVEVVEAGEY